MAGAAPEGSQFDTRHFDSKMNELLSTDGQDFFTSYDEVYDSFDAMGLQENLLRGIYAYGFEKPSAIQQRGIVPFTKGLDVIQQAQSGTGKTATFCSGILQQLDYNVVECQALVLAPTRELAQQIEKVMRALGDYLGVKVHACVGGTSVREDQRILSAGVHVVVGTPGRVFDMLRTTKLVFTVTFFTGAFQALFGLFRLGFLVDFLSQAAIVGFMAGAAIVIGLQQLKGLLAISHFTTKTDVVSVLIAVAKSFHTSWYPQNFILGCSFLIFILITRIIGKKNRKLFWLPAVAPLLSVIISTAIVYLTRADEHGVKIIKHVKGGLNPSSVNQLQFNSPHLRESVKIGLVCAVIALTEAVAVGRSFATVKGYNMDGNKEMIAMGVMNIAGSMTSCYVATGSFSRTAVNFFAGCQTAVSNVVMAITVLLMLQFLTGLLYYTPVAILSSIILSALPGLINYTEAYNIWKVDKLDFLACAGAFFGVLFASVEIGLMVAIAVSFAKIILNALRPRVQELGRLPGTDIFCEVDQYPVAQAVPGVLIIRLNSGLLCFTNANPLRDRILNWVAEENGKEDIKRPISGIILDMSSVTNIDYAGILALEETNKKLLSGGIKLTIASPRWQVIHKLKVAKFVDKVGRDCIFLTVCEAVDSFVGSKFTGPGNC